MFIRTSTILWQSSIHSTNETIIMWEDTYSIGRTNILPTPQNPLIIIASLKKQRGYGVLSPAGNLLYHSFLHTYTFPYVPMKGKLMESPCLCVCSPLLAQWSLHTPHDSTVRNCTLPTHCTTSMFTKLIFHDHPFLGAFAFYK